MFCWGCCCCCSISLLDDALGIGERDIVIIIAPRALIMLLSDVDYSLLVCGGFGCGWNSFGWFGLGLVLKRSAAGDGLVKLYAWIKNDVKNLRGSLYETNCMMHCMKFLFYVSTRRVKRNHLYTNYN